MMGTVHLNSREMSEAVEYLSVALDIAKEIHDENLEALFSGFLGAAYGGLGRVDECLEPLLRSMRIAREVGNVRAEGFALGNLGTCYMGLNRLDEALDASEKSAELFRHVGDRLHYGVALTNIGEIRRRQGDNEDGIRHLRTAIEVAREVGNTRTEAIALFNLASAYKALDQSEETEDAYRQGLAVAGEQHPSLVGHGQGLFAVFLAERGRWDEALTMVRQASVVDEDSPAYVEFLSRKGQVFHIVGEHAAAREMLTEAQERLSAFKSGPTHEAKTAVASLEALMQSGHPETP